MRTKKLRYANWFAYRNFCYFYLIEAAHYTLIFYKSQCTKIEKNFKNICLLYQLICWNFCSIIITTILNYIGGESMTQDEFIERYNKLNNSQKHSIEILISSFQTDQTYRQQESVVLEKDDYILSTRQLLPLDDYPHQKDN